MENIILGLLLLQARTIYQLRKRINDGLNLMYSCSTGSIQAALKKLLKSGYICISEVTENGKKKKLYSITDEGKQYFHLWINSPINNSAKNPELAKIYFMGFSEKENRVHLIENHLKGLRKLYLELQVICEDGERLSTELQNNEIAYYQLQTARYGRDLMKFNIDWYSRLLKEIRK
ncbi:MAG: PadR family transcriptional regulator [Clostridiales bacterium]|nr:PadR family transcriptional regulator [Clostridiales bacterium]